MDAPGEQGIVAEIDARNDVGSAEGDLLRPDSELAALLHGEGCSLVDAPRASAVNSSYTRTLG